MSLMSRKFILYSLIIISLLFTNKLSAQTAPPPLKNVKIQVRVTLDDKGIYHYYHIVTNPTENKIGIGDVNIDIKLPHYGINPGKMEVANYSARDYVTEPLPAIGGWLYVPIAWKNTKLWKGSVRHEKGRISLIGSTVVLHWWARYDFATKYRYLINPGETSEELEAISFGLPGIRKVVFKPIWWVLNLPDEYLTSEEDSPEEMIAKDRKIESLGCVSTTIGPNALPAYNLLQLNQMMQDYVNQSVALGWLKDNALTQQLNNYLVQVATTLNEERFIDAQNIITQFMNAVQNSNLTQRTNEAYALLYFNAKFFVAKLKRN